MADLYANPGETKTLQVTMKYIGTGSLSDASFVWEKQNPWDSEWKAIDGSHTIAPPNDDSDAYLHTFIHVIPEITVEMHDTVYRLTIKTDGEITQKVATIKITDIDDYINENERHSHLNKTTLDKIPENPTAQGTKVLKSYTDGTIGWAPESGGGGGSVNSVTANGQTYAPLNGDVNIGDMAKSVSVNNETFSPDSNGNINLGTIEGDVSSITVNGQTYTPTDKDIDLGDIVRSATFNGESLYPDEDGNIDLGNTGSGDVSSITVNGQTYYPSQTGDVDLGTIGGSSAIDKIKVNGQEAIITTEGTNKVVDFRNTTLPNVRYGVVTKGYVTVSGNQKIRLLEFQGNALDYLNPSAIVKMYIPYLFGESYTNPTIIRLGTPILSMNAKIAGSVIQFINDYIDSNRATMVTYDLDYIKDIPRPQEHEDDDGNAFEISFSAKYWNSGHLSVSQLWCQIYMYADPETGYFSDDSMFMDYITDWTCTSHTIT